MNLTARQQSLLNYFVDVARDLVSRGQLRQRSGESLVDVIKSEPGKVLNELSRDLGVVLGAMRVGLAAGVGAIAQKELAKVEVFAKQQVGRFLGELLKKVAG